MSRILKKSNGVRQNMVLSLEDLGLDGELKIPKGAKSIVMFVSDGSTFSRCNRYVANELNKHGLATLLFDLVTSNEESLESKEASLFKIDILSQRVVDATKWLEENADTESLRLGYFGTGIGSAAALVAAAKLPRHVHAVVSSGGRPDLAGDHLMLLKAPTLLIVGGDDPAALKLNRQTAKQLRCEYNLEMLSDPTHLFEEEGALERVAETASAWFKWYLDQNGR